MPAETQQTSSPSAQPSGRDRRQHYRAKLGTYYDITVRVWRVPSKVSMEMKPLPSQEIRVRPVELSVGGLTVIIRPERGQELPADETERLRIDLRYPGGELLIEGRLRTHGLILLSDGSIQTGIQFRRKDNALTPIIGALQRAELRFKRGIETPIPIHLQRQNSSMLF